MLVLFVLEEVRVPVFSASWFCRGYERREREKRHSRINKDKVGKERTWRCNITFLSLTLLLNSPSSFICLALFLCLMCLSVTTRETTWETQDEEEHLESATQGRIIRQSMKRGVNREGEEEGYWRTQTTAPHERRDRVTHFGSPLSFHLLLNTSRSWMSFPCFPSLPLMSISFICLTFDSLVSLHVTPSTKYTK